MDLVEFGRRGIELAVQAAEELGRARPYVEALAGYNRVDRESAELECRAD